jgi:hypothetical protein
MDLIWQQIITGVFALIITWAQHKLGVELKKVKDIAVDTHTLVNSNMGAQLSISAVALRQIAFLTKDPVDVEIASKAEKLLAEHEAKQRSVDASKES